MERDRETPPIEAADFYLGPPGEGEYLGTANDGHPDQLDVWTTFQSLTEELFTDVDYRYRVAELIDHEQWPHKHDSSNGTRWAYCWMPPTMVGDTLKPGLLVVHYHGRRMAEVVSNLFFTPPGLRADVVKMRPGAVFASQRQKVRIS